MTRGTTICVCPQHQDSCSHLSINSKEDATLVDDLAYKDLFHR